MVHIENPIPSDTLDSLPFFGHQRNDGEDKTR
jgi:hypothetical protein